MQPVKTTARRVDAGRSLDRAPRGGGEAELVDMIACDPFPDDLAVRGNLNEAIVFEHRVGDVRSAVVLVRQNEGFAAFNRRTNSRRVITRWKVLPLPVVVLTCRPSRAPSRLNLFVVI